MGVDAATAEAFKREVGADAILLATVESYNADGVPRISMAVRLLAATDNPRVLWADSVGLAGDDSPGILGLGVIHDPKVLLQKAVRQLSGSLETFAAGKTADGEGGRIDFKPRSVYRSPSLGTDFRENIVNFVLKRSSGTDKTSPARLEVALSSVNARPVTVEYAVTGGTAVRGIKYKLQDGTLTFAPSETVKDINIDILNDGLNADSKTIEVSLKNPTNALLGRTAVHTYTIINTNPVPAVTFTSTSQQAKENGGAATIAVELSALSGKDVTVPFKVSGTAKTPGNYTITASPVVIKAGTKSATIAVDVTDNGINEDDKTVVVSMGAPTNATQGKSTESTVTIVDSDPAPTVSFSRKESQGDDKVGQARFEVALGAASGKPVTVEYAVTGGTAIKGKDYAMAGSSLTFAPGETEKTVELEIVNHGIYDDNKTVEVSLLKSADSVLGNVTTHTYTIVNTTPMPTVSFTLPSSYGDEKVSPARLEVTLSAASGKLTTVEYAVTGGTAVRETNYTLKDGAQTLTFAPGETVKTIELGIRDDGLNADNRTIEVGLKNPKGAVLGSTTMHSYAIIDADPAPAVTFTSTSQQAKENGGPATIAVELSALSGKDVTVPFKVSGTAKTPGNYTITASPVVIKAGTKSATIAVDVTDNGINEDDKTVVVSMGAPTNATQGKSTESTVTIVDSDPAPTVSFSRKESRGDDKVGQARFEVALGAASGKPVTVEYAVTGGTAIKGKDYAMAGSSLTFAPGETKQEIELDIKNDGIYDDNKTVDVSLKSAKNAILGGATTHSHTIVNTTPMPAVAFMHAVSSGDEKTNPARLEVSLGAVSGKPVTVEYAFTGGTAISGKDYTAKTDSLTFAPGETNKFIELGIVNHGINNDDKIVVVSLKRAKNAVIGAITTHSYTIMNTTPMPSVAFTAASQQAKENGGPATIAVELSAPSGKDVTVPFTVSGTAKTPGNYTITASPVMIKAGTKSAAIMVSPVDNKINEEARTVVMAMGVPTNATRGKSTESTVTIVDSDPVPAVTFTSTSQQTKENGGAATIAVELSALSGKDVTVPFKVSGTAKTPGNYTITASPVVIKAGTKSATIAVDVTDNGINEDDKTVVVSMGAPTNATQGKSTESTVTIVDSDPAPTVSFSRKESRGDDKVGQARFEVALGAASGKPVTVEYAVTGGTAIKGKDYAVAGSSLTFAPGETEKTVELEIVNHGIYDDNKTVEVSLLKSADSVLGNVTTHTYTIVNTTPMPTVSFTLPSSYGDEKVSPARLEVTLSAASGKLTTVEYAVTGGTAVRETNYTLKDGAQTLTFAPGETVKTIELGIRDDGLNADNRTIEVGLKNPKGAVLGSTTMHSYAIIDADPAPAVTFTSTSQQAKENGGPATIAVELSALSGKDVTVPFKVSGTAKTPGNYTITASPVVIKAGTKSATIAVDVTDNGINEDDKTVVVSMGAPTNATQGKSTESTVTIVDSDPAPTVSFSRKESRGDDKVGQSRFEVALGAASGKPVTVEYAVTGGTAIKGKDYAMAGSSLTFAPGETEKTIELEIVNHGIYDDNKTIEVSLLKSADSVLGSVTTHTYTIVNTTPMPTISFLSENQRVIREAKTAIIAIESSALSGKDVIIPFTISSTTKKPLDYSATPNPAIIKAGSRSAIITVLMPGDDGVEAAEAMDVKLSSPANASLGRYKVHSLSIINRDKRRTIAAIPFFNQSKTPGAGEVVMLQFVKELAQRKDFVVIDPAIVRQELLSVRTIMEEGASLSDIDILIENINADLFLTGKVLDYRDEQWRSPKVTFSVMLIEKTSKRIIWSSESSKPRRRWGHPVRIGEYQDGKRDGCGDGTQYGQDDDYLVRSDWRTGHPCAQPVCSR